jgi:hypothetical protein
MSTRAQVRFATREDGVSFSEHPEKIHAQFYVHSDGYPEGLGLQIACSISEDSPITSFYGEIEALTHRHGDLEYIYYVWQHPDKETWISIFEVGFNANWRQGFNDDRDKCIFVGKPDRLIAKYKLNTDDEG